MFVFPTRAGWVRQLMSAALLATAVSLQAQASAPDPIEGIWRGTVAAPLGKAEIGFKFERDTASRLVFTLYFPVMNAYGVRFAVPVAHAGDTYTEPVFQSRMQLGIGKLTGTFGPGQLPIELVPGDDFPSAPPAPHYPAAPAPKWACPLGSPSWAAPVLADGVIYVGASGGQFHAVRARDGHALWTWTGPNRLDGRAVVSGDALYFVDGKNELVSLARAGGALRWRTALHDGRLAGKPVTENPTFNRRTATPLVLDGVVYCGSSDGGLYALDAATGAKLWRHDARAPIFSGINLRAADELVFGTMDGSVVMLDRRTHKETFRAKVGGGVVTTPVVAGGKVIVGGRDYFLYGLNVADGTVAWKFSYWFSWVESTGVLADGVFYVGASDYRRVTAFEPATGRALWATDVRGMDWGTPVIAADQVFIGTVAQNIPGTVLVHTGGIIALDRRTGAVRWQSLSPPAPEGQFGGYAGTLACDDDCLYAAGFDGRLIALPLH